MFKKQAVDRNIDDVLDAEKKYKFARDQFDLAEKDYVEIAVLNLIAAEKKYELEIRRLKEAK